MTARVLANVTCVAVGGRGIVIMGPPGSGKSTLALSLIDRGAMLIGDDGATLDLRGARLWVSPPPNIAGHLEIRGVGIALLPTTCAPLCLAISLCESGERLPQATTLDLDGVGIPALAFTGSEGALALRVEFGLQMHGLSLPDRAP